MFLLCKFLIYVCVIFPKPYLHSGISYFLKGFPGLTITSGIKMYPFFKPPFLVLKNTKVYTKPNKRNFYVQSYVHDCYMILGSAYYYYVSQEFPFNNVITCTWYTYNNYSYRCGTIDTLVLCVLICTNTPTLGKVFRYTYPVR